METKRFFFAMEIEAPWPGEFPKGRLLGVPARHLTLAFLGDVNHSALLEIIGKTPLPPLKTGFVGHFNKTVFLPFKHPRVVAWHADLLNKKQILTEYQKQFCDWLKSSGFEPAGYGRPWLPHVTLCRSRFDFDGWKKAFRPLPFIATKLVLYESKGSLQFEPKWSYELTLPIEKLADSVNTAYVLRGEDMESILLHARVALGFHDETFYHKIVSNQTLNNQTDLLNYLEKELHKIPGGDLVELKFEGGIIKRKDSLLECKMIVGEVGS
jgi:2'-5' RNA ligase